MTEIKGYHAHVYYNAETRNIAEGLRDTIVENLPSSLEPSAMNREARIRSRSSTSSSRLENSRKSCRG